MDAPPMPSLDRQGRRTACVALSATAGAVVIGIIVSLAVGPGGVEGRGAAAALAGDGDGGGAAPPLAHAMSGPSASASLPVAAALSSTSKSQRWFDCPPGVALAADADGSGGAAANAAASASATTVSFLVLGDWGRQGNANQRRVSDAMADVSACLAPSYVVSTGDNFYPEGLLHADDDQFTRSFAGVYGSEGGGDPAGRARLARLPFYAALGNHDTTEGRQGGPGGPRGRFQLTPSLEASAKNGLAAGGRWHCYNGTWSVPDPSRGARAPGGPAAPAAGAAAAVAATAAPMADAGGAVSFGAVGSGGGGATSAGAATAAVATAAAAAATTTTATRPVLDLIVIDTNPFVGGPEGTWREGEREALMADVREGLERRLRASRAAWRVVAGHHPVHSLGEHCRGDPSAADCGRMSWLAPLLREHGVAAYLAGHEHDLQLIFETTEEEEGGGDGSSSGGSGTSRWPAFVVSGGGSNIRSNEFRTLSGGDEEPAKPPPKGFSAPFVADQQGFVAAVANSTHLALHYYTLNHRLPSHTTVLARRQ